MSDRISRFKEDLISIMESEKTAFIIRGDRKLFCIRCVCGEWMIETSRLVNTIHGDSFNGRLRWIKYECPDCGRTETRHPVPIPPKADLHPPDKSKSKMA